MEIEEHYGAKTAARSGVLLMNHIEEGTTLLKHLGASNSTIRAYRIHPIYQDSLDTNLRYLLDNEPPLVAAYIVGYTHTANAALSDVVKKDYVDAGLVGTYYEYSLKWPIKLSSILEFNTMLIADKVQNYKDFLKYHKGSHVGSDELDFYFRSWLTALGVLDKFEEYCGLINDVL